MDIDITREPEGIMDDEWVLTISDPNVGVIWTSRHYTEEEALVAVGAYGKGLLTFEEYVVTRPYTHDMRQSLSCSM